VLIEDFDDDGPVPGCADEQDFAAWEAEVS
jgi:hypothetical protein